ncbi:MAG: ATP-dependent sacrificial sulfur transferase LarE [Actinobacteria bacterium]|nr:ATP-dependent sacrificial sulfur transferase LarE [Actinomycetota bacterium]
MAAMNPRLEEKSVRLVSLLSDLERVVVAYSGGVDSTLLAAVAHETLGPNALAITAVSPSLAGRELAAATELARDLGWNHRTVATHEIERAEYTRNSGDRCYWCKTELFYVLGPLAAEMKASIATGTNLDDLSEYRPGLRAAEERSVHTPLAEAGLSKLDVRTLSAVRGLPTADKPASPCLASRFAYGVRVTRDGLERIDAAEEVLRALGFEVLRVRDHGDLARIEVPPQAIERVTAQRATIERELKSLGFKYVTVDLGGFRSGSLNASLGTPHIRRA